MYIEESVLVGFTALAVKLADYIYSLVKDRLSRASTCEKDALDDEKIQNIREIKETLDRILGLLFKTDDDGVPLIYFPRRFATQQEISIDLQKENNHSLELSIRVLEKLVQSIDAMSRVLDRLDYKTK